MDFQLIRLTVVLIILSCILQRIKACGENNKPKICLLPNAHWDDCANVVCQDNCDEPMKSTYCKIRCCNGDCACNAGFIRAYPNGPCIPRKDCRYWTRKTVKKESDKAENIEDKKRK